LAITLATIQAGIPNKLLEVKEENLALWARSISSTKNFVQLSPNKRRKCGLAKKDPMAFSFSFFALFHKTI
jgi:hypothetical protein